MNNISVIKAEIIPHLKEIKNTCAMHNIPFFFAAVQEDTKDHTTYFTEILTPGVLNTSVTKDSITDMINVINGFETVPPHEPIEVDF